MPEVAHDEPDVARPEPQRAETVPPLAQPGLLTRIARRLTGGAGLVHRVNRPVSPADDEPSVPPLAQPEPRLAQHVPPLAQPEPEVARHVPVAAHAEPAVAHPEHQVAQTQPPVAQAAPVTHRAARRLAVILAVLLAAVIGVAFRGSWTAHSDGARAAHFDDWGAWLYPFAPDGLIVLALVGAVVLRHKRWPRLYCLFVVVLFTGTSYVVNHLHGAGAFLMTGEGENARLVKPLDGAVVGLIAGQLVGAIAFGSHILMHVFRHLFPEALDAHPATAAPVTPPSVTIAPTPAPAPAEPDAPAVPDAPVPPVAQPEPEVAQPEPSVAHDEPAVAQPEPQPELSPEERAAREYGASLDRREPVSERALADVFGISRRRAAEIVVEVVADRYARYRSCGGPELSEEELASQFRLSVARAGEALARASQSVPEAVPERATKENDSPSPVVQLRRRPATEARVAGAS